MSEKRTITLTDRPPVTISDDAWPLLASAADKEWDNQYECQANRISKWFIGVRKHDDGRAIVYATYSFTSNWQSSRNYYAKKGVLLSPTNGGTDDANIVTAIHDVAEQMASCECADGDEAQWKTLADVCIADMPAEELS